LLIAIAALASVAPLHIAAVLVFVLLPGSNALRRTRAIYCRELHIRGKHWHSPVRLPAIFATEARHSIVAVAEQVLEPFAVTFAAVVLVVAGLALFAGDPMPMTLVRLTSSAAVVTLSVWLVRRLSHDPHYSRRIAGHLVAPFMTSEGQLSSAGRIAWAAALGLLALAAVAPLWPLG